MLPKMVVGGCERVACAGADENRKERESPLRIRTPAKSERTKIRGGRNKEGDRLLLLLLLQHTIAEMWSKW